MSNSRVSDHLHRRPKMWSTHFLTFHQGHSFRSSGSVGWSSCRMQAQLQV